MCPRALYEMIPFVHLEISFRLDDQNSLQYDTYKLLPFKLDLIFFSVGSSTWL